MVAVKGDPGCGEVDQQLVFCLYLGRENRGEQMLAGPSGGVATQQRAHNVRLIGGQGARELSAIVGGALRPWNAVGIVVDTDGEGWRNDCAIRGRIVENGLKSNFYNYTG